MICSEGHVTLMDGATLLNCFLFFCYFILLFFLSVFGLCISKTFKPAYTFGAKLGRRQKRNRRARIKVLDAAYVFLRNENVRRITKESKKKKNRNKSVKSSAKVRESTFSFSSLSSRFFRSRASWRFPISTLWLFDLAYHLNELSLLPQCFLSGVEVYGGKTVCNDAALRDALCIFPRFENFIRLRGERNFEIKICILVSCIFHLYSHVCVESDIWVC